MRDVNLAPYLSVLRLPRIRRIMLLMLLARIPVTAASMTITLHVVLALDRGYGAAGLAGTASTIGIAIGSPLMGRLIDSRGLRLALVVALVSEAAFWFTAPFLSYEVLLVTALIGGIIATPTMSIGRQVLAALVPQSERRTALAMDSMAVEVAFMAGPAAAVLITTNASSTVAIFSVGTAMVLAAIALYVVNPPIRSDDEIAEESGERPPRREWLTGPLLSVLVTAAGAVIVLAGVEVSLVASLQAQGRTQWTGVLIIVMCVASLIGGFVYGGVKRAPGPTVLMALLGLLAIPVGLFDGSPWLLALALIPTNFMCAPTIAATGEAITRMVPASARGEAMGLQGSAFTLGAAVGAPLAGFVIDHSSSSWGYAVTGLGGVLIAVVAFGLSRRTTALAEVAG